MRRAIVSFCITVFLLSGLCCGTPSNASAGTAKQAGGQETDPYQIEIIPEESGTQETEEPHSVLIDRYDPFEACGPERTGTVMFTYDLDGDGTAEDIGYNIDTESYSVVITDGSRSITLKDGCDLIQVYLVDLDSRSLYRNLLVVIDMASDDYVTYALHPEGDRLVLDRMVYGFAYVENDMVKISERTEILGTNEGTRPYYGDQMTPGSEWLMCRTLDEKQIQYERDELIEFGTLLHLIRDVPITLDDGVEYRIPAGSCLYMIRFQDTVPMAEVQELDGKRGILSLEYDEPNYGYLIDGIDQHAYFDNVLEAG